MSDILRALILGIVQGLTEFLPVSSSGHLEIAKYILAEGAVAEETLLMTVILHFATALATIWVFRQDILEILGGLIKGSSEDWIFAGKIVLSMIPAVFVGLAFEEELEQLFSGRLVLIGLMLAVTALLLFLADRAKSTGKGVSWRDAAIIGVAQAIAIMPGISRSGATISTSVLLGIDRTRAARFSFLMVVPLIFGAIAKDLLDGDIAAQATSWPPYVVGFIAAFFTGVLACKLMIKIVQASQLKYFAYYCFVVAALAIGWGLFTGQSLGFNFMYCKLSSAVFLWGR